MEQRSRRDVRAHDEARRRQGEAAVSGARWLTAAQVFNQGLRSAMNLVLVWFLTTGDYGQVGVALVVIALVDQLADMGTGQAVIQREGLDKRTTDAVFALNLLIGTVLAGLVLAFAEPLAGLFGGDEGRSAAPLLRLLAVAVFVRSTGVVHFALLRRNFEFRKAALSQAAGAVAFSIVAVAIAVNDGGPWSIVWGSTVGAVVGTGLTWWWSGYRPSMRADFGAIRSIAGFSASLTANNLFNFGHRNLDRSLVSWNLGLSSLGLYALGVRILRTPLVMLTSTSNQVLVPVLSRLQREPDEQRRRFLQASAGVALVALPALAGLAVVADVFTEVAFNEEWAAAGSIIRVMALVGMIRTLVGLVSAVYIANGRTGTQLVNGVIVGSLLIGSYFVTSRWSVEAVVIGSGLVILVTAPFVLMVPFRIIELSFGRYLRAIGPAVGVAALTASAAGLQRGVAVWLGASAPYELVLSVGTGAVVAVGSVLLLKPTGLGELERILGLRSRQQEPVEA